MVYSLVTRNKEAGRTTKSFTLAKLVFTNTEYLSKDHIYRYIKICNGSTACALLALKMTVCLQYFYCERWFCKIVCLYGRSGRSWSPKHSIALHFTINLWFIGENLWEGTVDIDPVMYPGKILPLFVARIPSGLSIFRRQKLLLGFT